MTVRMHAGGFHVNPVPAQLYKAWASEFQRWQRFRLDHAQAYLYKPEHRSCKNVGASPAVTLGYACAWLSHKHSLTSTVQARLCTSLGVGDSIAAARPLTAD